MKIEGVPEGYELVRIGEVSYLESYLGKFGDVTIWHEREPSHAENLVILRKIERPKQYRPFANAEEFKPHRERWVRFIGVEKGFWKLTSIHDEGANGEEWNVLFKKYVFEDGTPFGVEVSE
jgi:hypothetical protein